MASREDRIARHSGVITWLAVPRKATLIVLILIGIGFARAVWVFFPDPKIISWLSSIAAPFCMICATFAWAMRDRFESVLDVSAMTSSEYAVSSLIETKVRRQSGWLAVRVAVAALITFLPALAAQFLGSIYLWMVLLAGVAVAYSAYAYLVAEYWDLQFRTFRHNETLRYKKDREQNDLLERMSSAKRDDDDDDTPPPWAQSGELKQ